MICRSTYLNRTNNLGNSPPGKRNMMRKSRTANTTTQAASHAGTASNRPKGSGPQPSSESKPGKKAISADDTRKSVVTERHSNSLSAKTMAGIRRLPNGDVKALIVAAIDYGLRHKLTKSGIMFFGENGLSTSIHFSTSDKKAARAIEMHLRQLGYHHPRK
jgi:hypothetical protein